jgi:hypothetical protein
VPIIYVVSESAARAAEKSPANATVTARARDANARVLKDSYALESEGDTHTMSPSRHFLQMDNDDDVPSGSAKQDWRNRVSLLVLQGIKDGFEEESLERATVPENICCCFRTLLDRKSVV